MTRSVNKMKTSKVVVEEFRDRGNGGANAEGRDDDIVMERTTVATSVDRTRARRKSWLKKRLKGRQRESPDDELTRAVERGQAAALSSPIDDNEVEPKDEEAAELGSICTKNSVERSPEHDGVPTNIFMPKVIEQERLRERVPDDTGRRKSLPDEIEKKMFQLIESAFVDGIQLGGDSFYLDEDDSYYSSPPSFFVSRTFSEDGTCRTHQTGTLRESTQVKSDPSDIASPFMSVAGLEAKSASENDDDDARDPLPNHDGGSPSDSPPELENGHEVHIDEYEMSVKSSIRKPHLLKRVISSRLGSRTRNDKIPSLDSTKSISSFDTTRSGTQMGLTRVSSKLRHHVVLIGDEEEDDLSVWTRDEQQKSSKQWHQSQRAIDLSPIAE